MFGARARPAGVPTKFSGRRGALVTCGSVHKASSLFLIIISAQLQAEPLFDHGPENDHHRPLAAIKADGHDRPVYRSTPQRRSCEGSGDPRLT
jgi:hypothetical protein